MTKIPKKQIEELKRMAHNLRSSSNFDNDIVQFSDYAEDLKSYILQHCEIEEIKQMVSDIPKIKYARREKKSSFFSLFRQMVHSRINISKPAAIEHAEEIASTFNLALLKMLMH